eukprot:gene24103-54089_t
MPAAPPARPQPAGVTRTFDSEQGSFEFNPALLTAVTPVRESMGKLENRAM